MDSIRSAGAIDVLLKAIEVDIKTASTVEKCLEFLEFLVGDSYDDARVLSNAELLEDKEGRGMYSSMYRRRRTTTNIVVDDCTTVHLQAGLFGLIRSVILFNSIPICETTTTVIRVGKKRTIS